MSLFRVNRSRSNNPITSSILQKTTSPARNPMFPCGPPSHQNTESHHPRQESVVTMPPDTAEASAAEPSFPATALRLTGWGSEGGGHPTRDTPRAGDMQPAAFSPVDNQYRAFKNFGNDRRVNTRSLTHIQRWCAHPNPSRLRARWRAHPRRRGRHRWRGGWELRLQRAGKKQERGDGSDDKGKKPFMMV